MTAPHNPFSEGGESQIAKFQLIICDRIGKAVTELILEHPHDTPQLASAAACNVGMTTIFSALATVFMIAGAKPDAAAGAANKLVMKFRSQVGFALAELSGLNLDNAVQMAKEMFGEEAAKKIEAQFSAEISKAKASQN
jgi:hypothetical protein